MAKELHRAAAEPVQNEATPPIRRPKMIERQGDSPLPYSRRMPDVIGGICEYCGVIDKNLPSEYQYKLCEHYAPIGQLRCTYCDATKVPDEVINHSQMTVREHPDNPDRLVVLCGSYNCTRAHEQRFSTVRR